MPAPQPLTATPPAQIDWSRPGTPAASDFDDIYFSVEGGIEETREVFLKGCGLPDRWMDREVFVIGETGFGTGLNFLTTWRLWNQTKGSDGRLYFISVEKHPLDQEQLTKALAPFEEFGANRDALIENWPDRVKGFHLLEFGNVNLILIHDDINNALDELDAKVDAWFLDGFSPAKNAEMWSMEVMAKIAGLSRPDAKVATFTVAGSVRSALSEAGFTVLKKEGFGRKRHRLEAHLSGTYQEVQKDIKPVILGAGIAGSCIARSFLRRGIKPVVIDPNDGTAASGNAAAIIKPRFDIQDRPDSRFFLASYLHALQLYNDTGHILQTGIDHIAKDDKELNRYLKLLENRVLPETHFAFRDEQFIPINDGVRHSFTTHFPKALAINPKYTRGEFLSQADCRLGQGVYITETQDGLIKVQDKDDRVLATGTHVFFMIGAGVNDLRMEIDLPTRFSRGQVSWAKTGISAAITYGGYAVPLDQGTLLGATHDRSDPDNFDTTAIYAARPKSDLENLQKFEEAVGMPAEPCPKRSRVSVRVNMPDTLPLIQPVAPSVSLLTGLGSRGFVFAPLLAEAIVAKTQGEPLPISKKVWAKFGPRKK